MSWIFHVRVLSWATFWGSCYSQVRHAFSGQIPETSLNLWLSVGYSPNKAHLLRSHWPLRWSSWSATVSRQFSCEIYSWLPQTMHFCPSELRKYEPSQDREFLLWPQPAPTQPLAYVLTFPPMDEEPVRMSCNFREHIWVYLCRTGWEKFSKSTHTSANQSPRLSCTPSKSGMSLLAGRTGFFSSALWGLWECSSPTREWIWALSSESAES